MKRIIITTNNLNRSKGRILTKGIKMDGYLKNPVIFYDHETFGRLPIGRMTDILTDDNGVMTGVPEFDEDDEFAMKVKKKYEKGYINAASLQVIPLRYSEAPEDLLLGQEIPTITESEMIEISLVGIPGLSEAVRLSGDTKLPVLQKLKSSTKMELRTIALSLGLSETATEVEINTAIAALKASQVDTVVSMGIEKGLITEANKATWVTMAQSNLENVKALVDGHVTTVAQAVVTTPTAAPKSLMETIRVAASAAPSASVDTERQSWTFDDWQKKDTAGLVKMRTENPTQYANLAQGYYAAITGHAYTDK